MLAQNVWRRATFFQHIVRKWRENHKFFFWFVFLKLFLRTSGMQFWQSFKKYLGWRPGNVHLLSEKDTKFYFPENRIFFPDMFLGTCRMQFRQQLKKFRQQAEIVCSNSKNDTRSTLFLEVFFQNCSSGQVEWQHSGKSDEKFSTEGRKTYAHCPKMKKEIKVDERFFSTEAFLWTL